MGGVRALSFDVSHRAVLQVPTKALDCLNLLAIKLLNDVYVAMDVMKYVYLCEAKVPYYGKSAYRHRAHDNASPLQDAVRIRGIVCKGWSAV